MPVRQSTAEFESLAFAVEARRGERPIAAARAAVRRGVGGQRWRLVPLPANDHEFIARPLGPRRLSAAQAWDRAYALRKEPQVVYTEPLFVVYDDLQHAPARGRRALSVGTGVDPRTDGKYEWPLENMKVIESWGLFDTATPGAGVRVGHPDTGYTRHPEIDGPRLRPDLGYDFEDSDANPHDELTDGFLQNTGHGTSTASVIMSARGLPPAAPGARFVSGTAPGAHLVPIRTTKSVVLWSMEKLVLAIHHAIAHGAHVVSISLGGLVPSAALHSAVRTAEARDVIVLCAAGNQVGFVVFPAAFDEVVAVAASDIADEPWIGSSRGRAVDITAPGHSVYCALVKKANGVETYDVERGSGTSFAVAETAGVAALWLSLHGRAALIASYGPGKIPAVFKQLLQATCRVPSGWDSSSFGPGIVHARRLLEAALPARAPARGMRGLLRRSGPIDALPLEHIVHLLTPAPRSGVVRVLAALLRVDEHELPRKLHETGDELAFRIATDTRLRATLVTTASEATARRRRRRGAAAPPARAPRGIATARRRLARGASRRLRSTLRTR